MPTAYYACVAALFAADVLLRPLETWKRRAGYHAAYLLLPYAPLLLVPRVPAHWLAVLFALAALGALFSFCNLVGLTSFPRYFFPTIVSAVAFFAAAQIQDYGLFLAMPVFTLSIILGFAVGGAYIEPQAFLQKLCLAWLGSLVYGYLMAHSAMFPATDFRGLGDGKTWDILAILCAKAGDTVWVAARDRLRLSSRSIQFSTTVLGAVGGGAAAWALFPPAGVPSWLMLLFGSVVGLGLAVGSSGYDLIVTDVMEREQKVPMKGTMLFGFAFSVASGYHLIRYFT